MTRHVVWVVLIAACGADRKDGGWTLSDRTQVILLGTGTPNADPARSGPATAVVVDGVPYIVDCGPGVVRRAAAAGLKASSLGHVFITHLHTDHTLGLPDLIFTCWVLERGQPLQVYGPPGTKRMTDHILAAYDEDIRIRLDGFEPANTEVLVSPQPSACSNSCCRKAVDAGTPARSGSSMAHATAASTRFASACRHFKPSFPPVSLRTLHTAHLWRRISRENISTAPAAWI